jgi:hypothetical protein
MFKNTSTKVLIIYFMIKRYNILTQHFYIKYARYMGIFWPIINLKFREFSGLNPCIVEKLI